MPLADSAPLAATIASTMDELESRPRVAVRAWMEPRTLGEVRLTSAFAPFDLRVRTLTRARPTARLYWFADDVRMGLQVKLQAASFAAFRAYAQVTVAPVVMVYDDEMDQSPEQPPAAELEAPDAALSAPRSTHSRPSVTQQAFRSELKIRDGGISCALCRERPRNEQAVDAAHVVPHGKTGLLSEAGLVGLNHADNGVFLCHARCHYWFDRWHWWLDVDLNVAATDALLADADEGPFFRQFVGRPLQQPIAEMARHWPTPQTWAVQRRRCEEKTAERHALAADGPFDCDKCGKRYSTTGSLKQHVKACVETQKRLLFTPAAKGAREPDGDNDADDDDGTDAASRSSGLDESDAVPALSRKMLAAMATRLREADEKAMAAI